MVFLLGTTSFHKTNFRDFANLPPFLYVFVFFSQYQNNGRHLTYKCCHLKKMQKKISIAFSDQLNIKLIGGTSFSCIILCANFSFLPVFVCCQVALRKSQIFCSKNYGLIFFV